MRRAENGYFDPRLQTAQKLADALHVRIEWLLTGDSDVIVFPPHMTVDEQGKMRPPEESGHPDTVLIVGPSPWYTDNDGEWPVEGAAKRSSDRGPPLRGRGIVSKLRS